MWIHCVLCSSGEGGRQYGYIVCSVLRVREGGNMDTLCALFLR